jgi:hypothetical protein
MTTVRVYNPRLYPVVYGNGQTIGGFEWAEVDFDLVHEFIESGDLIVKGAKQPVAVPEKTLDEISIDDSSVEQTEVLSDDVSHDEVVKSSEKDAPSDVTKTSERPATISKPRRRKTTTTERE